MSGCMLAKNHQKVGQSSSIHFFGMCCSAQSMQVMNLKVEKTGRLVEKLALQPGVSAALGYISASFQNP